MVNIETEEEGNFVPPGKISYHLLLKPTTLCMEAHLCTEWATPLDQKPLALSFNSFCTVTKLDKSKAGGLSLEYIISWKTFGAKKERREKKTSQVHQCRKKEGEKIGIYLDFTMHEIDKQSNASVSKWDTYA